MMQNIYQVIAGPPYQEKLYVLSINRKLLIFHMRGKQYKCNTETAEGVRRLGTLDRPIK